MPTVLKNTILSKISIINQENDLKQLTEDYPFFALPRYILLQETKQGSENWLDQSKKAGLLFSPFLLGKCIHTEAELNPEEIEFNEDNVEDNKNTKEYIDPVVTFEVQKIEPEPITEVKEEQVPEIINEPVLPNESIPEKPLRKVPSSPMLFVPLHTSDYFASQGIKISYDANPTDKLGKQLKSFTGWLQTMKHIHPTKINLATAQHDVKVEVLAEKSNLEDDVLTEAMAEAYLHQGKTGKALETYQKLSLLNPAKSTYFAAKINELQR